MQNGVDIGRLTLRCCSLLWKKKPKMLLCALFFYHFIQGSVKVFVRKMQSLLLAVSKNTRVPSAPKNVLIASLSALVLPCLRSDFSLFLLLTGLGLHGFQASCVPSSAPSPSAPCHDIGFVAVFSACHWDLQLWYR